MTGETKRRLTAFVRDLEEISRKHGVQLRDLDTGGYGVALEPIPAGRRVTYEVNDWSNISVHEYEKPAEAGEERT